MSSSENFRMLNLQTASLMNKLKVMPVLVLNSVEEGIKIGRVLIENGLPGAEVTFRTPAAADAIKAMSNEYRELFIGAGTVLNIADLQRAIDAGAKFAVAPGFNPKVVNEARERDFSFAPGITTASEIEQAFDLGCSFLKFFPAENNGGVKMLKAMSAPYLHIGIRFMPTGGITLENAAEYLALKAVAAVGGTWLTKSENLSEAVRNAAKLQEV